MSLAPCRRMISNRVFSLPQTRLGVLSIRLVLLFLVLFMIWLLYVAATPMSRPTFFSDPVHAVIILTGVAAAIVGGCVGVAALVVKHERSIGVVLSVLLAALVLFVTIAEWRGH